MSQHQTTSQFISHSRSVSWPLGHYTAIYWQQRGLGQSVNAAPSGSKVTAAPRSSSNPPNQADFLSIKGLAGSDIGNTPQPQTTPQASWCQCCCGLPQLPRTHERLHAQTFGVPRPKHWLEKTTNTEYRYMQTNATHQSSLLQTPPSSTEHCVLYLFIPRPRQTEKLHAMSRSLRGGKTGSGRLANRNITQSQPQTNSSVSSPRTGSIHILK